MILRRQAMKILLAEDDVPLAKSLKMHLERKSYTVTWAVNGKEALAILAEDMHDAVISDIQMPGGNGIQLLQGTWRTFKKPPPFYVHSSEDVFSWAGRQWDLPKVIDESFKGFAIFRSKRVPKMLQEIQSWLDSIEQQ